MTLHFLVLVIVWRRMLLNGPTTPDYWSIHSLRRNLSRMTKYSPLWKAVSVSSQRTLVSNLTTARRALHCDVVNSW